MFRARRETCFLCSNRRGPLHRFPKNPETQMAWIHFCGLNETTDNVNNLYLCSFHFQASDYQELRARELGNPLKLKPNTVPSVLKPNVKTKDNPDNDLLFTGDKETEAGPSHVDLLQDPDSVPQFLVMEKAEGPSQSVWELPEDVPHTPKRLKMSIPRYVGDIKTPELATPRRAKRSFLLAKTKISKQALKIKTLKQQNRRFLKKIQTMGELLNHLRKKNLISEDCQDNLVNGLPDMLKELVKKRSGKYSPELRKFAITLQFYSTAAYNYVRKVWKNLLPHPNTIGEWCQVVDGNPGFTKESLDAIKLKNRDQQIIINLVLDEMSIKKQMVYKNNRFYGGIDLGTGTNNEENDAAKQASNALVFMAVGINTFWKMPIGYFLIDGLSGSERANLLKNALNLIHETGAILQSITFDGAAVNLSMCVNLGANFDYFSPKFQPWFLHPTTNQKVYIFFDPCHMVKLVRNALGDLKILMDSEGNNIKWSYIENLLKIQEDEGLHAGTKLTKKHINFSDNRMNVKLAVQTLSVRVYNAFQFLDRLQVPQFEGCMPTAQFALFLNNTFDILNCRNKFAPKTKHFNIPINEENLSSLQEHAKQLEKYLAGIKLSSSELILSSRRKTGFLGLIICLRNAFELFHDLNKVGLKYFLTFKINQDFIETYFSAIRRKGGFNNNPNAFQFLTAYKRLLIQSEISASKYSNCLNDGLEILHVSAKKRNFVDPVIEEECAISLFDHDYIQTLWTLTPYVENVVKYIAGFVVKKIVGKKSMCKTCADLLISTSKTSIPLMIDIKNRGPFLIPSDEAIRICLVAERIFRENFTILFTTKKIKDFLLVKIFRALQNPFNCEAMNNHILSQDILDNHRCQLTRLVINIFLKIRLFHEGKTVSQKNDNIRQKYTKLILFKNQ